MAVKLEVDVAVRNRIGASTGAEQDGETVRVVCLDGEAGARRIPRCDGQVADRDVFAVLGREREDLSVADERGTIAVDCHAALAEKGKNNLLFARAVVGRREPHFRRPVFEKVVHALWQRKRRVVCESFRRRAQARCRIIFVSHGHLRYFSGK